MDALLREYLPHAPKLGLFVAPEIPKAKLSAALGDYATNVQADEVIALYDATRLGSGKDGALFLVDRLVFQNNNLQTPRAIRYDDIVRVDAKRKLLGGRKVEIDVNQGRATVTESIDFSGRPGAAEYVERFRRPGRRRMLPPCSLHLTGLLLTGCSPTRIGYGCWKHSETVGFRDS